MSDLTSNRELLEDWLQHPGTTLFFNHVRQEWGAGGARFKAAVYQEARTKQEREDKAILIEQIATAQREIERLEQWASEEVRRLKNLEAPADSSLRRPMPVELVGQGRRGTL